MQSLFNVIRQQCPPAIWSQGVQMVRSEAVVGRRRAKQEIELAVSRQAGRPAVTVFLYPDDEDWSCECNGPDDPCAHVAAAIIALRQSNDLFAQKTSRATVEYNFERQKKALALTRLAVQEGSKQAIHGTLAAYDHQHGPLLASQTDWQVDAALPGGQVGVLSKSVLHGVLDALAGHDAVRFHGEAVEVSEAKSGLAATVEECAGGFRIVVQQDSTVNELFDNGALRCGRTLHPIAPLPPRAEQWQQWRRGHVIPPQETPRLVTEILPELRAHMPVQVRTPKLPGTARLAPRLVFDTQREGSVLSILPLLVYGDPPVARVHGDTLTHLQGPVPMRDEAAERRLQHQLQRDLQLNVGIRTTVSGAAAVDLVQKIERFEPDAWSGNAHQAFYLTAPLCPPANIGAALGAGAVDFAVEGAAPAGKKASGKAVVEAWLGGEAVVALPGGGFAPLPADWLAKHGQHLAALLAALDAGASEPVLRLSQAPLLESLGEAPPPDLQRLRAAHQTARESAPQLPTDLDATLRAYQQEGVHWLQILLQSGLGGILADDMGLGKTLQTLCVVPSKKGQRTLVIAPTSVLHNWQKEAARFRPSLRVCVYHGPERKLDPTAHLTLTSYALLRLDKEALAATAWDLVVLDEAQAIKNPDSQAARSAYSLPAKARIALSGTPVENRLEELWSLFHFAVPGLLGTRESFATRFVKPQAHDEIAAAAASASLRAHIAPFVLRRLKKNVAPELPKRTDIVLSCTLSEAERVTYDAVRAATVRDVVERLGAGGSVLEALEALLRLRQAACHPDLLRPKEQRSAPSPSSKIDVLLHNLQVIVEEGHKALVFSQWTGFLDLIEACLSPLDMPLLRLDGSTRDRMGVVDAFQNTDGPPVLLSSLKAGGTGLNLTAADHVFLMDPWWNPAVEDQAADRTHRIGQDKPVFVHRVVASDTVEERILGLQEHKRRIAAAALGEGAGAAAALTREELLTLLA